MKDRSIPQLRSLWRNSSGSPSSFRGHNKTGFENQQKKHEPSHPFCPFGHCKTGIMSPMDMDLLRFTPKKTSSSPAIVMSPMKVDQLRFTPNKTSSSPSILKNPHYSSRKLFGKSNENERTSQAVETDLIAQAMFQEDNQNQFKDQIEDTEQLNQLVQEKDIIFPKLTENKIQRKTAHQIAHPAVKDSANQSKAHDSKPNKIQRIKFNQPDETLKEEKIETLFYCRDNGFKQVFLTYFGLQKHNAQNHSERKLEKIESQCQICLKKVVYLDQHMNLKHRNIKKSQSVKFAYNTSTQI